MDERENGGAEAEVWRASEAGSHRGGERASERREERRPLNTFSSQTERCHC